MKGEEKEDDTVDARKQLVGLFREEERTKEERQMEGGTATSNLKVVETMGERRIITQYNQYATNITTRERARYGTL